MTASPELPEKGKRLALVVGVNGTESAVLSPLKHALNDAMAVAEVLQQRCDFTLFEPPMLGEQASSGALRKSILQFARDREQDDFLLFYFSGHGQQTYEKLRPALRQAYLGTADFDERDVEDDPHSHHISMHWLREILFQNTRASQVLIVLDCCFAEDIRTGPDHSLEALRNQLEYYFEIPGAEVQQRNGGIRAALAAARYDQTARENDGHGAMTQVLLQVLRGEVRELLEEHNGRLSLGTVLDYVCQKLPPGQTAVQSLVNATGKACLLASYPDYDRSHKRRQLLRSLVLDHHDFLAGRLENFVGRQMELAALHQQIAESLPAGGYIIITGQAGQGKSSLIAKLIEEYGREQVAFHFIPLNPGPDHQVGLLRNLMARLILKYDLSDLYIVSESRSALRDYFPKVLDEIAARGKQEIIFIDGLDQLEEDVTGVRDLSFLPTRPPAGIVFVLGTRPNDTLYPLELLKPHTQYLLPNLSRADFDLILEHRHVSLNKELADQFYRTMQENALYLDLAAKELQAARTLSPEEIIRRVVENPDNLFSVSIERLKRHKREWREALKPILGILLVAREPLSLRQIRNILQIQFRQMDEEQVKDGMARLGGLVIQNGEGRYSLYHLKFREFLRQEETQPEKSYVFASDEEEHWHAALARWCEQGNIERIWQEAWHNLPEQGRRLYARWHYITHLYRAKDWDRLLVVLDEGTYGHSKIQFDPSMRFYTQDLAFGQQIAAWEGWSPEEAIDYLPRLWRYTLLRCSLISRADSYPLEAFRLMMRLGQEEKALGLAELLTHQEDKAAVLLEIASFVIAQPGRQEEALQLFLRVEQVARQIPKSDPKSRALRSLGETLTKAGCWIEAERVIMQIEVNDQKTWALSTLGEALAKADRRAAAERVWEEVEQIIESLEKNDQRSWALRGLSMVMARSGYLPEAEQVIARIEKDYQRAWALCILGEELIAVGTPDEAGRILREMEQVIARIEKDYQKVTALRALGEVYTKAGNLTEAGRIWEEMEYLIQQSEASYQKVMALRGLGENLLKAGRQGEADRAWREAHNVIEQIVQKDQKPRALRLLGTALAKAGRWEEAGDLISRIEVDEERAQALQALGASLAQAGCWEEAEHVISQIEVQRERVLALSALGEALLEAGQRERTLRIWVETEHLISQIEKSDQNAWILQVLGASLVKAGRREVADRVWKEAEYLIQKIEVSELRARALGGLGEILARAGYYEEAERVISRIEDSYQKSRALRGLNESLVQAGRYAEAECVISQIEKSDQKAAAWQVLGKALAASGRQKEAEHAWGETERLIAQIEKGYPRAWNQWMLAELLGQAGYLEDAERVTRQIERNDLRAQSLRALGENFAKAGSGREAERNWKEAEHLMLQIREGHQKAEALRGLGRSMAQAGYGEEAERVWREVERVIQQTGASYQKAEALLALGDTLLEAGHPENATNLWTEAERVIQQIGVSYQKATALRALGEVMAKMGRWEEAERAWAEAEQDLQYGEAIVKKGRALRGLGEALMRVKHWEDAERVFLRIEDKDQKAEVLGELGEALLQSGHAREGVELLRRVWLLARTKDEALLLFPLAFPFIASHPELGQAFYATFDWSNRFLRGDLQPLVIYR